MSFRFHPFRHLVRKDRPKGRTIQAKLPKIAPRTFVTTPAQGAKWRPTHKHRKGGLYRVLGHGTLEANRTVMTIYDDAQGTVWIRPKAEFEDGRFTPLG